MKLFRYWVVVFYLGFVACEARSEVSMNDKNDIILLKSRTMILPSTSLAKAVNIDQKKPALKPVKLISSTFEKVEKNGFPAGWKVTVRGDNARFVNVMVERDKKPSKNVVKIQIRKEASVCIDTASPAQLDPGKEYILVVQFKVDDMHYIGHWYNRPAGIRIYTYGTNNKHVWMAVRGEGDTCGWVTAILPFPSINKKEDAKDFSRTNVMLHCYNMMGIVRFRTPIIIERPKNYEITAHFELDNGTSVFGGVLTLKE